MSSHRTFEPPLGWPSFERSPELLDWLYGHPLLRTWHYLNFTSDTAIWEAPESGATLYVATDDQGELCEMVLSESELLGRIELTLASRFDIHALAESGDREI